MLHDAILALSALGFNEETANKMVSDAIAAKPDAADVETIVRLALSGKNK
jgi:Holliday junction resolvasome RuvABC DNA-binding subunit